MCYVQKVGPLKTFLNPQMNISSNWKSLILKRKLNLYTESKSDNQEYNHKFYITAEALQSFSFSSECTFFEDGAPSTTGSTMNQTQKPELNRYILWGCELTAQWDMNGSPLSEGKSIHRQGYITYNDKLVMWTLVIVSGSYMYTYISHRIVQVQIL